MADELWKASACDLAERVRSSEISARDAVGASVIPGRVHHGSRTCMSYHEKGQRLFVATAEDARIQVIDCLTGKADRPPYRVEREQVGIVQAT